MQLLLLLWQHAAAAVAVATCGHGVPLLIDLEVLRLILLLLPQATIKVEDFNLLLLLVRMLEMLQLS